LIGVVGVELSDGDIGKAGFLLHGKRKISGNGETKLTCAIAAAFAIELCEEWLCPVC
jgi:hypothetical protein